MVNLNICAKCPKCLGYEPSRVDKNGALTALPIANCTFGGPLLGDSDLPEECPYVVEQLVTEDDAFIAHENGVDEMRSKKCAQT